MAEIYFLLFLYSKNKNDETKSKKKMKKFVKRFFLDKRWETILKMYKFYQIRKKVINFSLNRELYFLKNHKIKYNYKIMVVFKF